MREIKFRAWNGHIMDKDPILYGSHEIGECWVNDAFSETSEFIVWMQSTGIKDKDGVDIYEGDIVCWSGFAPNTGDYGTFAVQVMNDDCMAYYDFGDEQDVCALSEARSVKVIGNIYENPELLNEKA